MSSSSGPRFVKVPELTLSFWILKILATTLGETAGDAVSMSLGWGYFWGTVLFSLIFLLAAAVQISASTFYAPLYWFTIIATTTVGTTLADFADRSLGIGYSGGVSLLFLLVLLSLKVWKHTLGSISIYSITSREAEVFYWLTIMFSQTLGTALGDWAADSMGLGYVAAGVLFGTLLAVLAVMRLRTAISRTALFWAAFVLTRPFGAVFGDFLDKPIQEGGLAFDRFAASAVLLILMLGTLIVSKQKAARSAH